MPGAIAMINVVGNLARGRPPRRPRPPLGDGGRHQDGCPAAARARAAVKPFECCRPHRFRPGTKASNTPNLEATTGQTPKELQSGFEFTGEEIDARDIAARPREGRDQTAPDRDPRRVPKTIRWASMPAASSRGRSAPTRFSTAGGSKLQLVSCSSNAKGLAAGLAPTSGQVVTQIQSASPRPVSAVRILYAQPRSRLKPEVRKRKTPSRGLRSASHSWPYACAGGPRPPVPPLLGGRSFTIGPFYAKPELLIGFAAAVACTIALRFMLQATYLTFCRPSL